MAQYRKNGIKFVSLYPSDLQTLDSSFRSKLKEVSGRAAPIPGGYRYCPSCGAGLKPPGRFCTKCGSAITIFAL